MADGLQDWAVRPEFWLIVGICLYVVESMFDTFYLGGAAIGAWLAAGGVWLIPQMCAGSGLQVGLPVMMWGAGTVLGCALTRYLNNRHRSPPDISDRPYSGESEDGPGGRERPGE